MTNALEFGLWPVHRSQNSGSEFVRRRCVRPVVLAVAVMTAVASLGCRPAGGPAPSVTNSIGMKLVWVEPGSFEMGNRNPERVAALGGPPLLPEGDWDEKPVHTVTITRGFYISETEVTLEQFRQFRPEQPRGEVFPAYVSGVSWEDAVAFCEWLSERGGRSYRLPTEAEWEYACRAGTGTLFSSGDEPPAEGAANAWGLKNMHAGVAEWVWDWYGPYPPEAQTDPVGRAAGVGRVVRGGGVHDLKSRKSSPFQGTDNYYRRSANRASAPPGYRGGHWIGFRVVMAPMPEARPLPPVRPFVFEGVRRSTAYTEQGPDPNKPYFRRRPVLPIPPENMRPRAVWAAGLHPGMLWHNHSPGLAAMPNGDLLAFYFTASDPSAEYWPNVGLIATRLRFGSEEWDIPDFVFDFADLSNGPALLWNDAGRVHLFLGAVGMRGIPFLWTTTLDSGSTWSPFRIVEPQGETKGYTPQPINSAFRGPDGAMYVATDGIGGTSLLWESLDGGATWHDTMGRTGGRHTTFAPLDDGRILGMGGKNTDIEGFMPQSISGDRGRSWRVAKTGFPSLGSNQRPVILRLASGRLFFAGDWQDIDGHRPRGTTGRGVYVALSDDRGRSWQVKTLPGALPHESRVLRRPSETARVAGHRDGTLGYAAACQAPNGVIHLITSMNHPAMHFEFNEAWILDPQAGETAAATPAAGRMIEERETYPDGKVRLEWRATIAPDGRVLLHGRQRWYYPNGNLQYEARYRNGSKEDREAYYSEDGRILWEWRHGTDGASTWTQYWPSGAKKAESTWKNHRCKGVATRWDSSGGIVGRVRFEDGEPVE